MQGQLDIGVSKAICIHGRKVAALMNCVLTKWVLVRISVSPKGLCHWTLSSSIWSHFFALPPPTPFLSALGETGDVPPKPSMQEHTVDVDPLAIVIKLVHTKGDSDPPPALRVVRAT